MRRLAATLAACALALAALPSAAAAHGDAGAGTDYRSTVTAAPAGVDADVLGGDDRLRIARRGAAEVLVLGYQGEPFLRLDGDGVWRNEASLAARLADERAPAVAGTSATAPAGAPDWRLVDAGGSAATYHDHRMHWMGSTAPAAVRAAPGRERRLDDWQIDVVVDGAPGTVAGTLDYVPPPSAPLWWGLVAAALALGAVLGLRLPGTAPARIGATLALGLLAVLEAAAAEADGAGRLGPVAAVLLPGAIAAGIAWRVRRQRVYEATALALAALVVAALPVAGRLAGSFAHGVLPSPLPETATRAALVLVVGATALVLAAAAAAWRGALAAGPQGASGAVPGSGRASQRSTTSGSAPSARR